MNDATQFLFASEKIYTVLTVVLIILGGFLLSLLRANRRISRLEQQLGAGPLTRDTPPEGAAVPELRPRPAREA